MPPKIACEREPENVIVVDENTRITHPLVRDAAKELRSRPADYDGISPHPEGLCGCASVKDVHHARQRLTLSQLTAEDTTC